MVLLSCSQFDEFEDALRGVDGRYLLRSRGTHAWRLHMEEFGGMTAMVARNGASAVYQGALPDSYALLVGLTGTGSCTVNGDRLCRETVVWVPPRHEFHAPAESGVRWLSVVVPNAEVKHWIDGGEEGLDLRFMGYCAGRADKAAVERVASLIMRGMRALGRSAGPRLPDQGLFLRHQLMDAVLATLKSIRRLEHGRRGRPHVNGQVVVDDVVHLIDQRLDQPLRITDFCKAVGVSPTTLQKVFHERLGMSPHHYVMQRRLHAIHSALRDAGPSDTISSICSQYGVWDFGRFAVQYRQLFGVSPSSNLKRHSRDSSSPARAEQNCNRKRFPPGTAPGSANP